MATDWEAYLNGFKAGHLDRRNDVKNYAVFTDTYRAAKPARFYHSAGYRKGWTCQCNG